MSTNCSEFITDGDTDDLDLCRCPKCKGFLPRNFPLGGQFLCKKCGTVLETIPSNVEDPDEEEGSDYEFGGRICLVPDYAVKIDRTLPPKVKTPVKKKTSLRAVGRAFFRRVWEDGDGKRYVEFYPDKVELTDPRILKIIEDPKEVTKKNIVSTK